MGNVGMKVEASLGAEPLKRLPVKAADSRSQLAILVQFCVDRTSTAGFLTTRCWHLEPKSTSTFVDVHSMLKSQIVGRAHVGMWPSTILGDCMLGGYFGELPCCSLCWSLC